VRAHQVSICERIVRAIAMRKRGTGLRKLRVLYRDHDRAPYLYVLRETAKRRGLTLDLNKAELGGRYAEFLLDGATDVLAENYWGLQSAAAGGTPLVSLATAVNHLNEQLFVHPSIARLEDLQDKCFALRGVGPSELIVRLWLKDHGLAAIKTVVVSEDEVGRWGHWKTVVSGRCHGAFVTNFYQDEPLLAGLKAFPLAPYGFIGNVTLTSLKGLVKVRTGDFADLVSAVFEASRMFRHDPRATLEILQREPRALLGLDEPGMERVYGILREELSEQPLPSLEALANTHRMRLPKDPNLAQFNPLLMWDLTLAREATGEPEPDHRP
jgi:hypothetical protein